MDVAITTSDPENVSTSAVVTALIGAVPNLYYVRSVKVVDRDSGLVVAQWGEK